MSIAIMFFVMAAVLMIAAILYFTHTNHQFKDYLANIAINNHARQMSMLLHDHPLPGDVAANLVGSMTSTKDRLRTTSLALESILLQNLRPAQICLYISDELHPDDLPLSIRKVEKLGVTIRFVPDVGPHTKLIYALREFPDKSIITFDDDFYYPPNVVETLFRTSLCHPGAVIGNWVRKLRFDRNHNILKAKSGKLMTPHTHQRKIEDHGNPVHTGYDLFAYGTSGILYPPGCMDDHVFDIDCFRKLCPTEDDIWFKAMTLLKGTPVATTSLGMTPKHHCIQGSQCVALRHKNYASSGHATRTQIRAVFDHFQLYKHMQTMIDNGAGER